MSDEKKPDPKTDEPPAIVWEHDDLAWEQDSSGGIGIIGVDGQYAARRAAAWRRIIAGCGTDEDRKLLASLWTE